MDGPYEGKKAADKWYPVRLRDFIDCTTGELLVVVAGLTVTYGYEAATSGTAYSPAAGNWKEQGLGDYWLQMGADEFASEGKYTVNIRSATSVFAPVSFVVEVRDSTVAEWMDGVTLAASQHVIVDSGTVTTVSNAVLISSGTGAGQLSIASGVVAASGNWNVGKTGYSLTTADWAKASDLTVMAGDAAAAATAAVIARKILQNKTTITFGATTVKTIYADNGTDVYLTALLTNNAGTKYLITDYGPANEGALA